MNDRMRECWNAALGILKPLETELRHGLELHAASVVIDAYGFAPNAAVDGEKLKAALNSGCSEAEFLRMKEEMVWMRCLTCPWEREEYQMAWRQSGVTCVFQNASGAGEPPMRLLKVAANFTHLVDSFKELYLRATTPDDILDAKRKGLRCLYFSSNAIPLSQEWLSSEEELRHIHMFFQLGYRMMHLTYNRRNMLGDGCAEPGDGGLSDLGRAAVAEMNRVGMIVDVAHSGWRTSLEAAVASVKPVMASHSACCGVNRHIRNKPDEVIKAIVNGEGVIGIACVPAFLGGAGDIRSLLDHIDYVAKRFGVEHVAIGTDYGWYSSRTNEEWAKVPSQRKARHPFWSFWPVNDPLFDAERWGQPQQLKSLTWTNWPLFTVGLVQRGYSDNDIQKIIGGNILRVAQNVLEGVS